VTDYDAIVIGTGQAGPYVTSRLAGAGSAIPRFRRCAGPGKRQKGGGMRPDIDPSCRPSLELVRDSRGLKSTREISEE
jgi:pyruvate/2-oxoglutarate dehydrogenase complex dihydrolipoamide dehydrogenase (E3) component